MLSSMQTICHRHRVPYKHWFVRVQLCQGRHGQDPVQRRVHRRHDHVRLRVVSKRRQWRCVALPCVSVKPHHCNHLCLFMVSHVTECVVALQSLACQNHNHTEAFVAAHHFSDIFMLLCLDYLPQQATYHFMRLQRRCHSTIACTQVTRSFLFPPCLNHSYLFF
jgi:hypothetical protein